MMKSLARALLLCLTVRRATARGFLNRSLVTTEGAAGGFSGYCPAETSSTVVYNGYVYRTLTGFSKGDVSLGCEDTYTDIPSDYELAPDDAGVVTNVISPYPWGTHIVCVSSESSGACYNGANFRTPGDQYVFQLPSANPATVPVQQRSRKEAECMNSAIPTSGGRKEVELTPRGSSASGLNSGGS